MALTLLAGELTWQKVAHQLATQDATPAAVDAFRILKDYLVGNGNPDVQLIPFTDTDITTNTGYSPIGAVTSTVYAVYVKKLATATDAFVRLYNDTTNTDITKAFVSGVLAVAGDEFIGLYPKGLIFASDLTISADTGAGAGTESTALDAGHGFVLVGA